jgi:hypothetical protein
MPIGAVRYCSPLRGEFLRAEFLCLLIPLADVFVEPFMPDSTIVALDIGVLLRLPGWMWRTCRALSPGHSISLLHQFAAHIFRIFVASYGQRLAALFDDLFQALDDVLGMRAFVPPIALWLISKFTFSLLRIYWQQSGAVSVHHTRLTLASTLYRSPQFLTERFIIIEPVDIWRQCSRNPSCVKAAAGRMIMRDRPISLKSTSESQLSGHLRKAKGWLARNADRTAKITRCKCASSTSAPARTMTSQITTSNTALVPSDTLPVCGTGRRGDTRCPSRASRRQPNSCCGCNPLRCAVAEMLRLQRFSDCLRLQFVRPTSTKWAGKAPAHDPKLGIISFMQRFA